MTHIYISSLPNKPALQEQNGDPPSLHSMRFYKGLRQRRDRGLQEDGIGPFYVVDQDRNYRYPFQILNGTVINMDSLGSMNLNIEVEVAGPTAEAVVFYLGGEHYSTDAIEPYRLGPNVDFVLSEGVYLIKAESYPWNGGGGGMISSITVEFAVVSGSSEARNVPEVSMLAEKQGVDQTRFSSLLHLALVVCGGVD